MIYIGNSKLGSIYLGSTKISEAYIGSTKIFSSAPAVQYPYLLIEFDNASYTPSLNLLYTPFRTTCTWTRESSSPNVWKLEIHEWNLDNFSLYGLSYLFKPSGDSGNSSLTMDCSLVGSGNMDVALNGEYCRTFDRMFNGATGLTSIDPIHCTTVQNVGNMFGGCTNVEEGALAQYNWFSTYALNINNHSDTFTDCGSSTTTGAAELAQIPVGWGGNLVPASTEMVSYRGRIFNNYDLWDVSTYTYPIFPNISGMYILTQSSVSTYAGVSMNRSRIRAVNGLGLNTNYALYFYPCFMRYSGSALTWCYVTSGYNGMLAVGQGNTDMPGTLDYSAYGPFTYEFGAYDTLGTPPVSFCFLVTNVPIDQWQGLTDKYGILYNSNFKTDAGLRYFF